MADEDKAQTGKAPEPKEADSELLKRTGQRFAEHVLRAARTAPSVREALLAARDAVTKADPSPEILRAALDATMPLQWLDDDTREWLDDAAHGDGRRMLATFAAFWTLGYDKGFAAYAASRNGQ